MKTALLTLCLGLAACSVLGREEIANRTALAEHDRRTARYTSSANRVVADSGLVFEFGSCIRYTFNSVSETLVRDQGYRVDPARPRTVATRLDTAQVTLTEAEWASVLDEADRIGLWTYPAVFGDAETINAPDPERTTISHINPHSRFRIDLRQDGRAVSVRWSDGITAPLTARAERLRALGYRLADLLRAKPTVAALPAPEVFCL